MKCSENFALFYLYFSTASAVLSILGALSVMVAIIKFDHLKTFSFKILFYISITDFFRGIAAIVQNFASSRYCGFVAFVINTTFISSTVWAICLSYTLYQIVVKEECDFEKKHKYWFFMSFITVPFLEALPFITNSFSFYDGMCQITLNFIGNIYRFLLLYIPGLIMIIGMFWLFSKVYFKVKLMSNSVIKNVIFDRGLIYPIILAVIIVPLTITRAVMALYLNCSSLHAALFLNGIVILHGFINSLVFFCSDSVRNMIASKNCNTNGTMCSLNISFRSTFNE